MRRLNATLSTVVMTVLFVMSTGMTAQPPAGINYQAVVRNSSNELVKNQQIDVRFTILEDSTTAVYQEEQNVMTNSYGLFSAVIGHGTVTSGSFDAIDWANHEEYIKVEVDMGSGYNMLGTSQLQSVPYALNAKHAQKAMNAQWDSMGIGQIEYQDSLPSGTDLSQVSIGNTKNLENSANMLQLEAPSPSNRGEFQFLEMNSLEWRFDFLGNLYLASVEKASIHGDGTADFKNLRADTLGSHAKPDTGAVYPDNTVMAWGYINMTQGKAYSDFGIDSVHADQTGVVTITLDNGWTEEPAINVTPITGGSSMETPGIESLSGNDNQFKVKMFDASDNLKNSHFMVVVLGRMK